MRDCLTFIPKSRGGSKHGESLVNASSVVVVRQVRTQVRSLHGPRPASRHDNKTIACKMVSKIHNRAVSRVCAVEAVPSHDPNLRTSQQASEVILSEVFDCLSRGTPRERGPWRCRGAAAQSIPAQGEDWDPFDDCQNDGKSGCPKCP